MIFQVRKINIRNPNLALNQTYDNFYLQQTFKNRAYQKRKKGYAKANLCILVICVKQKRKRSAIF